MGKIEGKRILIIAAGAWQVPVIQKAQSMGLKVVATDKNPEAPGLETADFPEVVDIIDLEETLKVARKYKVDAVITEQTDYSVPTAAYVAEKMGLPGISYEAALSATNKWLMREKCRKAGIPMPAYRKVDNLDEALGTAAEIGPPVVIKPVDNQSSRGVSKIWNMDEIPRWFEKTKSYAREGSVLVEEMMFGTESSAEGFVAGNNVYVFGICDKTKCPPPYSYDIRLIYPAFFAKEVVNEIKTMNEKIISAIGITMGITHAEYIVTDRGVRLIEIAARGCGSRVASDLIPAITGVDITEAKIRQSLGEKVELGGQRFQKSGILEFLMLPQGIIKSIRGLDKAKKIKGVIDVEYHVKVGDTVGIIDSGRARPGYLLAVGETREEVLLIAKEIKSSIGVEVEVPNVR